MFAVEEIEKQQSHIKQINLKMNGHPDKLLAFQYKYSPTYSQIQKFVESKWNNKYKNMKIFNVEGVQYQEEDLLYLKDNEILYISKGEQFDANSSFGEYQIIKNLGEGGFGKVCLGKHKTTGQLVAIKIMKANKIDNAHDIDLVFRQVQNLKALNHPNIVKIYNCYTLKQMQVVLIMEYMEGGELLNYLKNKQKFTEQQARVIFKQIVNAITYCHFKNIIHRDLKLENILMKEKNSTQIKVADFGISGVASQTNPDVDSGTLKYMSPQVLSGKQKQNSPMIDVWALGCILYYMLIGKLPFVAASTSENIKLIIEGNLKFPKDTNLSLHALSLIKKMLDVNPKTRIKMIDIQDSIWLMGSKRDFFQRPDKLQKVNSNVQFDQKAIIKKQHQKFLQKRKPKPSAFIQIPKRLQKEKDLIENQLKEYEKNHKKNARKAMKSENKNSKNNFKQQKSPLIHDSIDLYHKNRELKMVKQ